jgi:uncharacterized coiled-coil protein SlyX
MNINNMADKKEITQIMELARHIKMLEERVKKLEAAIGEQSKVIKEQRVHIVNLRKKAKAGNP